MYNDLSLQILNERYFNPGENLDRFLDRVAGAYSSDAAHKLRIRDYLDKQWFLPATPVLANAGHQKNLPISCFLNEVQDSMVSIVEKMMVENTWLACRGGGIGTSWSNVRSIGEAVGLRGTSSGVIPFLHIQNAQSLGVSQGNLRRGSTAAYINVSHPEIMEFLDIRKPTGGDPSRKALNLNHAVIIPNEFMVKVKNNEPWELKSPRDGSVLHVVNSRELWIKILETRLSTGEPYLMFVDQCQTNPIYNKLGLKVNTSNLCNEIFLATGLDHYNRDRTAVCCLSSLNVDYYDAWKTNPLFVTDIMRFLDNVLTTFEIKGVASGLSAAVYAASRERSVGLGVMGFHSYLQSKGIPFESAVAKSVNTQIFKHIHEQTSAASQALSDELGACPDAAEVGVSERFTNKTAIAPTASISLIANQTSAGIEPVVANVAAHKTLSGTLIIKNRHLVRLLSSMDKNSDEVWKSITANEGKVSHLTFLSDYQKETFKTAYEIDNAWVIDHAADRQPFIDQGQSLNLFLPADVTKRELNAVHMRAYEKGLKGLYYLRSTSVRRAEKISNECLACE